jgi:hypothetical protein
VLEQIARVTIARLECIEREQWSDFRWLLGIILGGFGALFWGDGIWVPLAVAMLAAMARGFPWI